jgi:hypothetical protein
MRDFGRLFRSAAGQPASLSQEADRRGCGSLHGISASRRRLFGHLAASST